jgi:hypothetical protein
MEPSRAQAICLWVQNEAQYLDLLDDLDRFRDHLMGVFARFPELFPDSFAQGFHFHDKRRSAKLGLTMRRIKLKADSRVYLLRPCFVAPYCTARAEDLDVPLYLRLWGVSFDALGRCFGRAPKFYERAFVSLASTNLVAATCKTHLPEHLVADEKHVTTCRPTHYLCVSATHNCLLGAELVEEATTAALARGYGVMVQEAQDVQPDWSPRTVCLDGFRATQAAFAQLLPRVTIVLCFLHAMLKLRTVSPRKTREQASYQVMMEKGWEIFKAPTRRHFAQRLRRFKEWAAQTLRRGKLKHEIEKMHANSRRYSVSYAHPGSPRTSNAVDRVMSHQSHILRSQRGFHGSREHASQMMRAHAMVWNFHPYGVRLRREDASRRSPFHDYNGFEYHEHWLCNLWLASSRGGLGRASHQIRRS